MRPMGINQKNRKTGRGPKNPKKTLNRLFGYIFKRYKGQLFIVFIGVFLTSAAQLASSYFLKDLFNVYLDKDNLGKFAFALLIMSSIYLIGILFSYIYNRLMINISQGVLKDIRDELFVKMETLPIKYFDTHTHGDLMSRYTNDIDTLRQMISQSLVQLVSSFITIVGALVLMVILSPILTIISLLIIFLMLFIVGRIAKKSGKYFMNQQNDLGKINGYIEEMIEGQKVIKVFCHEKKVIKSFDELNEKLEESAKKANTYANILPPLMGNLGHIQYVVLAIIGAILAINNVNILGSVLDLGKVIAFITLSKALTQPISMISQQLSSIVMALAGAERLFDMLDEKSEVDEGYVTLVNAIEENGEIKETDHYTGVWAWKHPHQDGTITYKRLRGDVTLNKVDFGYNDDKIVLNDVSLYAEPGQKIAFVGATGAGKTTITNLINRFYDVQDGKIRYDGININKIKKADLRRSLSMVLQDTHLFTGTIMDNIRYGKLDATDEEVIAAAKLANADFFIRHLPDGYNTIISGDGSNLSQGQRQLLAIARAAVANPPVLILDEATSSIDTRTESLIEKGMDKLMEGRTVFVIAHRLSTVRNSNAIMVLENGQIIERGNHDDLIKQKGKYYQLYTGAFELS